VRNVVVWGAITGIGSTVTFLLLCINTIAGGAYRWELERVSGLAAAVSIVLTAFSFLATMISLILWALA